MKRWWYDFIGLLFPRICACCEHNLWTGETIICTSCLFKLPRTQYHREVDNPVEQIFWGRVQVQHAASFLFFNKGNRVQQLIHQLKYNGRKDIGIHLGKLYGTELMSEPRWKQASGIIPVPLHPRKKAKRGFNQSEEISRGISEVLDIPVITNHLIRRSATTTQTRKNRFQRWKNVEHIFAIRHPEKLENKTVILVDDIITTGATIEACMQTLHRVKGIKVLVLTLGFTAR